MSVKSILMVCHGNICRSPMAEGFFSHQLHQSHSSVTVSSAGIHALVNHSADSHAEEIMKEHHIDISAHRARQLTNDLVRQTDLILVMTEGQRVAVEKEFLAAKGRTFLIGQWSHFEIQDPFKQPTEMFEAAYKQIEQAWQDWKTRILPC